MASAAPRAATSARGSRGLRRPLPMASSTWSRPGRSTASAAACGKTLGRPKIDAATEARIRTLRAAGHGIDKTAKLAGVGVSAVQRILAAAQ
jgi:Helix-turn-helix domain of resolvase